jgi:hypothetical protein
MKFVFDVWRSTLKRNFDVIIGRPVLEACSATWNVGTSAAFALGRRADHLSEGSYGLCKRSRKLKTRQRFNKGL